MKNFYYILDSVKVDLQGYSNFRKCAEAEDKLTVALRYVLVIVVRINTNYIITMVNTIGIHCNIKGNYTRKSKSYTKLK
jgi:hypothetical protein